MAKKMSILIVDDEVRMAKAIRRALQQVDADFMVYNDAVEAMDYIKNKSVDLLITDYMMPQYSGLDLIKTMKDFHVNSLSILVTGSNDFNIAVSAVNQGSVHQFVTKPFNRDSLILAVEEAVETIEENYRFARFKTWSFRTMKEGHSDYVYDVIQENALEGLLTLMRAKDTELYEHSNRIANLSVELGQYIELTKAQLKDLYEGALLHDIGKLAIKDFILDKPGKLEEEEYHQIKKHAEVGADLLAKLGLREIVVESVRQHHERVDGNGYPNGLTGDQILIQAKIISITDVYDAMRSERAYKKGYSVEKTIRIMGELSGKLFDEEVLKAFFDLLNEKESQ